MRQLRTIVLTIGGAALGVVAGRWYARARRDGDTLLAPVAAAERAAVTPIGLQDVIPGVILAFRLRGASWQRLGLPVWFVAFAVNGLLHAYERELGPAFRALGLTLPGSGTGHPIDVIDVPHRPAPDPVLDVIPDLDPPPLSESVVAQRPITERHEPVHAEPATTASAAPAASNGPIRPAIAATDAPVWSPAGPVVVPPREQPSGTARAATDEGTFIPSDP